MSTNHWHRHPVGSFSPMTIPIPCLKVKSFIFRDCCLPICKVLDEQDDNGEFIGPRPPSPDFLEKMRKQEQRRDRVNDFVREKLVRDKQEERKRKAEMLVQQLKTKTTEPPVPADSPTVNPILVEKFLNVKTERTSSTVLPPSSHRSSSRSHSKYRRRSRSKSSHRRTRRTSHK